MFSVQGLNVLITGGSRGIGKGLVARFAEAGAKVAFTYVSSVEKAKQIEADFQASGHFVKGYQNDAADYNSAESLIQAILADFGGLDVLINNAGITKDNLLMRMSEDQWDDVLNTNLKSTFIMTKAAIKPMMKARKGSIINITSVVGVMGNAGQSNYAASKAGMLGFTKSIAKEVGSRFIRCNAIAPGYIETEMTGHLDEGVRNQWLENIPLKRAGNANDVADACIYLASDASSYMTGQTLHINGGMLM